MLSTGYSVTFSLCWEKLVLREKKFSRTPDTKHPDAMMNPTNKIHSKILNDLGREMVPRISR